MLDDKKSRVEDKMKHLIAYTAQKSKSNRPRQKLCIKKLHTIPTAALNFIREQIRKQFRLKESAKLIPRNDRFKSKQISIAIFHNKLASFYLGGMQFLTVCSFFFTKIKKLFARDCKQVFH